MLIHDALVEYIVSHDTEIKHGDLTAYIAKLTHVNDEEKETILDRQFKVLN